MAHATRDLASAPVADPEAARAHVRTSRPDARPVEVRPRRCGPDGRDSRDSGAHDNTCRHRAVVALQTEGISHRGRDARGYLRVGTNSTPRLYLFPRAGYPVPQPETRRVASGRLPVARPRERDLVDLLSCVDTEVEARDLPAPAPVRTRQISHPIGTIRMRRRGDHRTADGRSGREGRGRNADEPLALPTRRRRVAHGRAIAAASLKRQIVGVEREGHVVLGGFRDGDLVAGHGRNRGAAAGRDGRTRNGHPRRRAGHSDRQGRPRCKRCVAARQE